MPPDQECCPVNVACVHVQAKAHALPKAVLAGEVPASATEIIVVRHGETTWNRAHRIQGQMESDLNEAGRQQAKAVGARLALGDIPFTAVYSSDLRRAADTAQAIADCCGRKQVVAVEGLRERHAGAIQGLTTEEALEQQPWAYQCFMSRNPDLAIPGEGESLTQLRDRVVACLEELAKKHRGERVVVVSHGGAIVAMHKYATGKNPRVGVRNASINLLRLNDDGAWDMLAWGEVDHLSKLEGTGTVFGGGLDSA